MKVFRVTGSLRVTFDSTIQMPDDATWEDAEAAFHAGLDVELVRNRAQACYQEVGSVEVTDVEEE